jgi:hypothetical protein
LWHARELPDVGEPFDVALATRPIVIADTDNAFVAYAEAHKKIVETGPDLLGFLLDANGEELVWSKLDPRRREFAEKNRAALAL